MSRRFSEAEARRIFARAAEQQRADAPDDGLSLAELQEIGQAAGLDAAAIAVAASEVEAGCSEEPVTTFLGVRSREAWTRVLPVDVSDAAWERMVAELRHTFKQPGNPSQIGRVREWTSGFSSYGSDGLRVALEPVESGTRVVMEQSLRSNVRGLRGVAAGGLGIGTLSALLPLLTGSAELWALPALLVAAFALVVGASALVLGTMSAGTEQNVAHLLDRFDLIARDAALADTAPVAGDRIDPVLLDADTPEAAGPASGAQRMRS